MPARQESLFGHEAEARFDASFSRLERRELAHGAWIELQRGWVTGHATLFDAIADKARWREQQREMYERTVDVPRLIASFPPGKPSVIPVLDDMRAALAQRYGTSFPHTGLAMYRDGNDSVAWHGDYVARELEDSLVATVSLGEPRKFLMRPKIGGKSIAIRLGWGDLLVMGGTSQRTWDHAVPKAANVAGPRISVMFRPEWFSRAQHDTARQ